MSGEQPAPSSAGAAADAAADELAARVALLSLPKMGPARAAWLLEAGPAVEVVAALASGRLPLVSRAAPPGVTAVLIRAWTAELRAKDRSTVAHDLRRHGVIGLLPGDADWPFTGDPDPPALLFCLGRRELLGNRPKVALVGSRRCSAVGRQVAHQFGRELGELGVTVVSGLAAGIDGAAHDGTLAGGGPALAVVGSGVDVVYPGVNRGLWGRVAREGLVVSESPLGTRPEPWRFPARNRLIAALADVVVVVESHERGGALITASEAADRGRPVLAVPGAVTNPAAAGTNALLADGCAPACSVADILAALGPLGGASVPPPEGTGPSAAAPGELSDLSDLARAVLSEIRAGEVHLDVIIARSGRPVPAVLAEIQQLEARGLLQLDGSSVMLPPWPARPEARLGRMARSGATWWVERPKAADGHSQR